MNAQNTEAHVLRIRRIHNEYLVSVDHPSPQRIQARLDEVATRTLEQTLVSALSPWFANTDSSLWFIQRLDVELDINAACEQEQLSRAWAAQIAQSMAITIQGGSDGENVLWFPNRATYLARFLADVTDGRAWSKWYFESFEGLKLLPVSATLRTVVCEQPAIGEGALRQLSETELKRVLRTLNTADARHILERLAAWDSGADEFSSFEATWAVLGASRWELFDFGGEWQNALQLYLAASLGAGGGIMLKTAVLALLRFANRLINGSSIQRETLVEAMVRGDRAAIYTLEGAANAEWLMPLLRCPSDWLKEVGIAMLLRVTGSPPGKTEELQALRFTPFGGLFLLFPILDEWPLDKATHGWPDVAEIPATAILRLLLLAKCCGQSRAQRVLHDNLIRDLLGIPADFSMEMLGRWQKEISGRHCQTFLSVLTDWLSQKRAIYQDKLILCVTTSVAVLLDSARGIWLAVEEFQPSSPTSLPDALRTRIARATLDEKSIESSEAPLLFCDPEIFLPASSAFPAAQTYRWYDEEAQRIAEEDSGLAEILARLDKLPGDLIHLSLPESWGLSPELDHTLSVAAQSLMRNFAWRLPGFAHSNLPYLYGNFLDFSASLEDEPGRRVIRVGRPPLHLILNMTSIVRGTYHLNWLDERPFVLFPEQ
jgi:hypothetical protein